MNCSGCDPLDMISLSARFHGNPLAGIDADLLVDVSIQSRSFLVVHLNPETHPKTEGERP